MIPLYVLILIFIAHFIGDFVLQSNKMAQAKSHDNKQLLTHVGIYSATIGLICGLLILPINSAIDWVVMNAILHFITDYFTSKLTTYYYKVERRHAFFVAIGFDQSIHFLSLTSTYLFCKLY